MAASKDDADYNSLLLAPYSGQSANIFSIEDSAGTAKLTVDSDGDLTLAGGITLSGDQTVTGDVTFSGTPTVSGDITLGTDPDVGGNFTISGDVAISGDVQIDGALTGDGVFQDPSYSTSEVTLDRKWIGGETLYRKVVSFGALPNSSTTNVAHGITSLALVVRMDIIATASGPTIIPIPWTNSTGAVEVFLDGTNISITTNDNKSSYTTCYVVLEYTRSA